MAIAEGNIGKEICEALGLDPSMVIDIDLRIHADEPVYIDIHGYASKEQLAKGITCLKKYKLIDKDDVPMVGC